VELRSVIYDQYGIEPENSSRSGCEFTLYSVTSEAVRDVSPGDELRNDYGDMD
jgi:hypothetical protein